jgi:hypothetical protein
VGEGAVGEVGAVVGAGSVRGGGWGLAGGGPGLVRRVMGHGRALRCAGSARRAAPPTP